MFFGCILVSAAAYRRETDDCYRQLERFRLDVHNLSRQAAKIAKDFLAPFASLREVNVYTH